LDLEAFGNTTHMIKASLHTSTTVAGSIPKKQVRFHDHSTHCHHYEQMALMEKEP
jgi:hypothetical protein